MAETSRLVEVRQAGETVVARLVGAEVEVLYEGALIREIGEVLYELGRRQAGRRLVVNLRGVKYAATEMLGKLASLNARMEQSRGRLTLCELRPDVREALRIVRLLNLFDVVEAESEAVPAPAGGAGEAGPAA
jgi:anti-sigma B factor antagonist